MLMFCTTKPPKVETIQGWCHLGRFFYSRDSLENCESICFFFASRENLNSSKSFLTDLILNSFSHFSINVSILLIPVFSLSSCFLRTLFCSARKNVFSVWFITQTITLPSNSKSLSALKGNLTSSHRSKSSMYSGIFANSKLSTWHLTEVRILINSWRSSSQV